MGNWLGTTGVLGALAVALGAFGAHGLKNRLSAEALGWWQTAVQYHFYHVLALFGVALLIAQWGSIRWLNIAAILYVTGIVLFSGSLYVMALTGTRWLGAITPLGGLAWIIAWVLLTVVAFGRG